MADYLVEGNIYFHTNTHNLETQLSKLKPMIEKFKEAEIKIKKVGGLGECIFLIDLKISEECEFKEIENVVKEIKEKFETDDFGINIRRIYHM